MSARNANQLALKVVSRPSYYEGDLFSHKGQFANDGQVGSAAAHSLHKICSVPFDIDFSALNPILQSFSRAGDRILDPFCRSGGVGLEASLSERKSVLVDTDPVSRTITAAKAQAADLTEVALWLQMTPLKAPVGCDHFEEVFSPFFDMETFREVAFLRRTIMKKNDHVAQFVAALSLGLLHGRGAGNLSVYSPSERVLSPEQQRELNFRRHQTPDYRALAPRVLRKSAFALQDGLPSILRNGHDAFEVIAGEGRNLSTLPTGKVDLTVTNPPIPRHSVARDGNWLRRWFLGLDINTERSSFMDGFYREKNWSLAMNEVLVELARLTRPAGRAVLFCDRYFSSVEAEDGEPTARERILSLVENELSLYWEPECYLSMPPQKRSTVTGRAKGAKAFRYRSCTDGVLVLRRK